MQSIYEFDVGEDVSRFVCTDRDVVALLDSSVHARDLPEKLLLQEEGDEVGVTLYLDEGLLAHLHLYDPIACLDQQNISQYWVVLEGISHFLYFSYNCQYGRAVSLYEMELQAEVDKFVSSLVLLLNQQADLSGLYGSLFYNVSYDAALAPLEARRYREADHYASLYCQWLYSSFIHRRRFQSIVNELRRFYRLPHHRKTQYILSIV